MAILIAGPHKLHQVKVGEGTSCPRGERADQGARQVDLRPQRPTADAFAARRRSAMAAPTCGGRSPSFMRDPDHLKHAPVGGEPVHEGLSARWRSRARLQRLGAMGARA